MNSEIVADSGHVYTRGALLRRHPQNSEFDIFKAEFDNKRFIAKKVSKPFFTLSQRLASDLASYQRLRMHVDCNSTEDVLVFPYFRTTLLALLRDYPDFPPYERTTILRGISEAVRELHTKDWVHSDIKPDNVLVNGTNSNDNDMTITDVALGDFDIACKLKNGETRVTRHAVGNVMWRSPEAQTGMVNKPSDIYSLGLVFLYTLGAGDLLVLDDNQGSGKADIIPEQEVVTKHFCYFGPVPNEFYTQIKDEDWRAAFESASDSAEAVIKERPELRFRVWGREVGETAVELLSGMLNLDPRARPTIEQVLAHPYWQEAAEEDASMR